MLSAAAARAVSSAQAAFTALRDPMRGDAVARLGDLTGSRLLIEKPVIRLDTIDMERLACLPSSTFGHAYHRYMAAHGFSPDERDIPQDVGDSETAYVMRRYRETHDFTHTLVGLPPTVLGELAVKWFEMVQTGLPVTALAAFVGPLRLPPRDQLRLARDYVPWAARAGRDAEFLLAVRFEDHFETDLDDLRRQLRVAPAPPLADEV